METVTIISSNDIKITLEFYGQNTFPLTSWWKNEHDGTTMRVIHPVDKENLYLVNSGSVTMLQKENKKAWLSTAVNTRDKPLVGSRNQDGEAHKMNGIQLHSQK